MSYRPDHPNADIFDWYHSSARKPCPGCGLGRRDHVRSNLTVYCDEKLAAELRAKREALKVDLKARKPG